MSARSYIMVNKNLLKVPLCLKWSVKVICPKNPVNIVSALLPGVKNGNEIGTIFDIAHNDVKPMRKDKRGKIRSLNALAQIDAPRPHNPYPI